MGCLLFNGLMVRMTCMMHACNAAHREEGSCLQAMAAVLHRHRMAVWRLATDQRRGDSASNHCALWGTDSTVLLSRKQPMQAVTCTRNFESGVELGSKLSMSRCNTRLRTRAA
jgi:hypothetical protein